MDRLRRGPLGAIAVALALSCAAAACASSSGLGRRDTTTRSAGTGTWVWRKERLLDAGERKALLDFARAHRVTALYVADAAELRGPPGFDALADFVRRAHVLDADVAWVGGDPSWGLDAHHASALALVDRAAGVNDRLRAASLPQIRSVQFDVEPYLLPEWKERPDTIARQYVALLASLRQATEAAGVALWVTIPFWFGEQAFDGTTLDREVLRYSDGVVIMAYRSTAAGVAQAAEEVLRHADAIGCRVVVALETSCREPPETTMCGASAAALDDALAEVRSRLGRFPSLAGLAVHQYDDWRQATVSTER